MQACRIVVRNVSGRCIQLGLFSLGQHVLAGHTLDMDRSNGDDADTDRRRTVLTVDNTFSNAEE